MIDLSKCYAKFPLIRPEILQIINLSEMIIFLGFLVSSLNLDILTNQGNPSIACVHGYSLFLND